MVSNIFQTFVSSVLSFKLKTNTENEQISSQLKTIKSNLREIYVLIEKHLLSFDSNKLESNSIEMTEEIINLFNITKQKTIKICNQFNFDSLLDLINNLSLLEPNIS